MNTKNCEMSAEDTKETVDVSLALYRNKEIYFQSATLHVFRAKFIELAFMSILALIFLD